MKKQKKGAKRTIDTVCKRRLFRSKRKKKKHEINFSGGDITSDAGAILLEKVDKKLSLSKQISSTIKDPRQQSKCDHSLLDMVKQRLYSIALGYEDVIDQNDLRHDKAIQALLNSEVELASPPTLCRFESYPDRKTALHLHKILLQHFISSHKKAPAEIILDFDPTDDETHGNQEGTHFNGYYSHHCFLPLYVFCKDFPLIAYLRPSNQDGAKHVWAILSLLVKNIRKTWPHTKIIFRGDSGLCRHKMLDWCERNNVGYVCGIGTNKRLSSLCEPHTSLVRQYFDHTQEKQKHYAKFEYAAKTWKKKRCIILKAEHLEKGANPRMLVTNLDDDPQYLYEKVYCPRGEMENRIKEQQLGLFADRTSCSKWWANQFRLLMATLAYVLIEYIRRELLAGTKLARACATTIRLKLLKIGAIIIGNTRRIRFFLSSSYPMKDLFLSALAKLTPS